MRGGGGREGGGGLKVMENSSEYWNISTVSFTELKLYELIIKHVEQRHAPNISTVYLKEPCSHVLLTVLF